MLTKMLSSLRDVSLRAKITISFVLIVICGTSISTFMGSKIITRAMLNEARKQIRRGLQAAEIVYDARLESIRKSVAGAAEMEQLALALKSSDKAQLPQVLSKIRDANKLHFLSLVKSGEGSVPIPELVTSAIANGNPVAGTEIFSHETLIKEDPNLAERARVRISQTSQSEITNGMVMVAAAPVRTAAGAAGALYGGILLNRDSELVSRINAIVFGGKEDDTAGTVSIFMNDARIATSTRGLPDQQQTGTLTASKPIRDHSGKTVGILFVGVPENPFLDVRTSMMLTFLLVAVAGVIVVLGVTYFITRSMIHPLEEMVKASNRIAAGDLDHSVTISSRDEIGILANSFNKMLASIKTMKLELEEWGRTLEEKVNKRTEELVAVRTQMAQSEKLASIGRLAAGVAHEINNPLGGILTFSMLALEDCDEDHPLKQSLEVIVKQTLRCRDTVKGLLDFARQSSAVPSITEVNSVVDKTLLLLENQTIFQNIKIVRKFDPELPNVLIDAGQLQQVVMNIVINAVDAMEESGVLTIDTCRDPRRQEILIKISDTGKGIPEDVLPLIFEPFFTTKKVGKGTGLGLAIVHGIITRAGGKVEVENSPNGATFIIRLPIVQEEQKVNEPAKKDDRNRAGKSAERR
jgi:two-component system, NtrC family, sensor kinase